MKLNWIWQVQKGKEVTISKRKHQKGDLRGTETFASCSIGEFERVLLKERI